MMKEVFSKDLLPGLGGERSGGSLYLKKNKGIYWVRDSIGIAYENDGNDLKVDLMICGHLEASLETPVMGLAPFERILEGSYWLAKASINIFVLIEQNLSLGSVASLRWNGKYCVMLQQDQFQCYRQVAQKTIDSWCIQ